MTPADLRRVVVVEELDLSSDGRLAVVARRSIQGDRLLGHLFALRLDGRVVPRPQALTRATVLWRGSPLRNVTSIRTPLLLLQAESDLRCPPQDNEQLFIALRHLRRTVEYVLYPDESHTYASSGRPDRRIDRMTRMLDWFDPLPALTRRRTRTNAQRPVAGTLARGSSGRAMES